MNQCPYSIASLEIYKNELIEIFEVYWVFVFILKISIQSKKHSGHQDPLVKIIHSFIGIKITKPFVNIIGSRFLNLKFI